MKKQHIFKHRVYYKPKITNTLFIGNAALTSLKQQRFDFVYIRTFKKLFRRKFFKDRIAFFRPKFWLFLDINILLTVKSKNSRMGAGVGKLVRLSMQLYGGKNLIEFFLYDRRFLQEATKYLYHKCSLTLKVTAP